MKVSELTFSMPASCIVDDQESNIELLRQLLGDAGYTHVTWTTKPHEVCALHRNNGYDLILLDLQMPGTDGFQVIEALKTNDADGYLPVLVITAQPGHKLRALQAGARDFISKPFDLVEVKTRIRNMLEVRLLYQKLEHYNERLEGDRTGADRRTARKRSPLSQPDGTRRRTGTGSRTTRTLHQGVRPGAGDARPAGRLATGAKGPTARRRGTRRNERCAGHHRGAAAFP